MSGSWTIICEDIEKQQRILCKKQWPGSIKILKRGYNIRGWKDAGEIAVSDKQAV